MQPLQSDLTPWTLTLPGMQRSTKQFCWVNHLQKSQPKKTLLCLVLAMFFQCKSETVFWIETISVANRKQHCHSLLHFGEFIYFNSCLNFLSGKCYFQGGKNVSEWLQLWISFSILWTLNITLQRLAKCKVMTDLSL